MKYPVGTVFAARMLGAKDPNDMVRATVLKQRPRHNEYELSIKFQLSPGKDYDVIHNEKIIDNWLADNWHIEYNPTTTVRLDEELFTL